MQIKAFPALNCPQQTSFSVHFLFSAACELWRRSPGSICPGWTSGRTHRRTPHSVSSPCPGKSPLPASCPAARPPSGTTCSRRRTKSSADRRRCRHRPAQGSFRPRSCSTPGVSGRWLVSSGAGLCGNTPCLLLKSALCFRLTSPKQSPAFLPRQMPLPSPAATVFSGQRRQSV